MELDDVWGIGYRYSRRLQRCGIHTAWQLRNADENWIRQEMGVVGARIVQELRGIPCLHLELCPPPRQGIASTRSFKTPLVSLKDLKQAVASFTARAAEKLRRQNSLARAMTVSIRTNPFRESEPQYANSTSLELPVPTASTSELIDYAMRGIVSIFRPGFRYKRVGVMFPDIISNAIYQPLFWDDYDRQRETRLMETFDRINAKMGMGTVRFAAMGDSSRWGTTQQFRSQRFTTCWDEIAVVNAR